MTRSVFDVTGFEMRDTGLWRVFAASETKGPVRLCGKFEIRGEARSTAGEAWALLLRWHDRDGVPHEWLMPRHLLSGDATELRKQLSDHGLDVSGSDGARRELVRFLCEVHVAARVRTVPLTGWFRPAGGGAVFVLPGRSIGGAAGEIVRLDLDPLPTIYQQCGTLAEWQREVATLCLGNTRGAFAVACSFAAPLLPLLGDEGGGFNFRGESSKGKTTLIDLAASVWGAPSKTGPDACVRQWRSTGNAMEATAAAHNHVLLPMDELGQADPREIGEMLYMFANGAGKGRARPGGGNRATTTWLTLLLPSSEESLPRLAEAAGRRTKAGQEVRLLDIPAVVAGGHGCFEQLHGAGDGKAFAQAIRQAVIVRHGTAGPAFVKHLAERMTGSIDFIGGDLRPRVAAWCRRHVPPGADGQVQRAANRFAVVAIAGELATEAAITGWPAGAAAEAVGTIFRDWLRDRGSLGSREDQHLFTAWRRFLVEHGTSRFEVVRDPAEKDLGGQVDPDLQEGPRTMLRAGWRWQERDSIGFVRWVHGMAPAVFDAEVAGPLGMEGSDATRRLGRAGLIVGKKEGGVIACVCRRHARDRRRDGSRRC